MNEKELLSRIERSPDIMFGKPVIKGTRLPVEILLEKIAYGNDINEIKKDYPFITDIDIKAAILYAVKVLSLEEEYEVGRK
jgi:uncharacterized protein (DUF433 family)